MTLWRHMEMGVGKHEKRRHIETFVSDTNIPQLYQLIVLVCYFHLVMCYTNVLYLSVLHWIPIILILLSDKGGTTPPVTGCKGVFSNALNTNFTDHVLIRLWHKPVPQGSRHNTCKWMSSWNFYAFSDIHLTLQCGYGNLQLKIYCLTSAPLTLQ